jgi:hypothetical protein
MSDDLSGRRADDWFQAVQPHEINSFKQAIKNASPRSTASQIEDAVGVCRNEVQPSQGRDKLKHCVLKRLGAAA